MIINIEGEQPFRHGNDRMEHGSSQQVGIVDFNTIGEHT
jgi:hypothetical protein